MFRHRSKFAETKLAAEKLIKFPVPNTFVFEGSECFGLVQSGGRVEVSEDLSPESVLDLFELESSDPVAVRKRVDVKDFTRSICTAIPGTSLGSIVRSLSDLEELVCIQAFCKLGKPSMKPRVFRVFYSSNPELKPFAYLASNSLTPAEMGRKENVDPEESSLTRQFCVSFESTRPVKIAGKAIEAHALIAKQVSEFVENFFSLRMNQVVVDILEDRSELKMVQLKNFSLKPFVSPLRQLAVTGEKYSNRRGSLTTTANAVWYSARTDRKRKKKCLMCGEKKAETSKLVTGKLVSACLRSLGKRGVFFSSSWRMKNGESFRCCDMCYSLVVNEQEVRKLEKRFGACLVFGSDISIIRDSSETENIPETGQLWRLVIGITEMLDVPSCLLEKDAALVELEMKLFDEKVLVKFRGQNVFCTIDFFSDFFEFGDVSVSVAKFATGSLSVLDRLVSLARFSKQASTTVPCFLGIGRWSVGIFIGVSKENFHPLPPSCIRLSATVAACPAPIGTRPLPEAWLAPLAKLRRERRAGRGARSRSNSRSKI